MKRIPESPEMINKEYVTDWQTAFGREVESIILYGSGARGEYIPGKSDINFLVIVTPVGMTKLRQAVEITEKWRKHAVAVPLVLTRDYVHASLDSFPIEFLNMKLHHTLVFGQDVLADLEIPSQNLRLQLEREVKGKLLHLRQILLGQGYNREALREALLSSIKPFAALFEALLFLHGETVPSQRKEVFQKVVRLANLNGGFVEVLFRLQNSPKRLYREELWELAEDYLAQIEALSTYIDRM
ncbi:MAG: nucleotidyltransferase domain-containing protein [candidate division KSB1 bacterium]|nr:nucleotidyltransferase domain-containing protein [candidate division KSB1 bacterium]MDZ7304125.1 nucleotidyltransferase domain-containing protein [candidate division KSB1 bacterium]MDZ7314080.1 nucleotidyltransferase domain-containing protein [candidate division KSB1 bacterium]